MNACQTYTTFILAIWTGSTLIPREMYLLPSEYLGQMFNKLFSALVIVNHTLSERGLTRRATGFLATGREVIFGYIDKGNRFSKIVLSMFHDSILIHQCHVALMAGEEIFEEGEGSSAEIGISSLHRGLRGVMTEDHASRTPPVLETTDISVRPIRPQQLFGDDDLD